VTKKAVLIFETSCSDAGMYEITITVTDDGTPNLSDEETFTLEIVEDCNAEPIEVVEEPIDEVIEEPVDEVIEEPVDEVIEEPVDEVIDEENFSEFLYGHIKNVYDELERLSSDNLDGKNADKMEKAIRHLEKSLNPDLWLIGEENRLNPDDSDDMDYGIGELEKKGEKVFKEMSKAVKLLMHILKDNDNDSVNDQISDMIAKLVTIDRQIALIAIQDAQDLLMNIEDEKTIDKMNRELKKANDDLERAEMDLDRDKPDKAINDYKKAWKHAQHAIKKGLKFLEN